MRKNTIQDFWAKVDIRGADECWNWTAYVVPTGYGYLSFCGKPYLAHRFAYKDAYGELSDSLFVCHKCDNRRCCNPAHLFAGTHQDNMRDMINKNRGWQPAIKGEEHSESKLTVIQVLSIRNDNRTQQEIATDYKVSRQLISNIKLRKTWRHI